MIIYFFLTFKGCSCNSFGSKGMNCDDSGTCSCKENFQGTKCDQCLPQRYNSKISSSPLKFVKISEVFDFFVHRLVKNFTKKSNC